MVIKGMRYDIRMERDQDIDEDRVVALVTFHEVGRSGGNSLFSLTTTVK